MNLQPTPRTAKRPPPTKPKPDLKNKDAVDVYCRLRPSKNVADINCLKRYNDTTVQIFAANGKTEQFYSFKHVFPETANQKEIFEAVAHPLVKDLVGGKNGLLFTYGVTSSGKTYTVTGNPQNNGMLPRCLDVLFNSIQNNQSRKYIFKPDGQNNFIIRTTPDALLEWQKEKQRIATPQVAKKTPKVKKKENDENKEWESREKEEAAVDLPFTGNTYAVFISFIEIYNNYIYDLLDESISDVTRLKQMQQPQSKMLREDARRRVYVNGGTELEVKSADEALDLYIKGIRRRRMAHTALNAESSRSHSVFNIRLVQAPTDADNEVVADEKFMVVSQLSLVDLAGSERTNRTNNTGERLREASNINNSLMALRNCIEILRENQKTLSNKIVPYRENKLTHLFKSFFEGQGKIRMVICVSPGADDYDETLHVMKFAETTQEVMVTRSAGLTLSKHFLARGGVNWATFETYGPPFPTSVLTDPEDDRVFPEWFECLEQKKVLKEKKFVQLLDQESRFRERLTEFDAEYTVMKHQNVVFKKDLQIREEQVKEFESKLSRCEIALSSRDRACEQMKKRINDLEEEVEMKNRLLDQSEVEVEKLKMRMRERLQMEKDKLKTFFDRLLAEKQAELEREQCVNKEKMHLAREILNADNTNWEFFRDQIDVYPAPGNYNVPQQAPASSETATPDGRTQSTMSARTEAKPKSQHSLPQSPCKSTAFVGDGGGEVVSVNEYSAPPVVNPRHRRSLSSGTEKWIDHRPPGTLSLGTVLQPKIKNKKSVTNLKDLGAENFKHCSKYALTHHVADVEGDVETQVYKGEVIPSVAGGAQVIFQDIETLKQSSPPGRKRLSEAGAEVISTGLTDFDVNSPNPLAKRSRQT